MRVFTLFLVKYTSLVQVVDADLPRAVDDLFVAHDDAYMGDDAVLIAEEGQVARLCLLKEIHQVAALHLLRGIAGQDKTR